MTESNNNPRKKTKHSRHTILQLKKKSNLLKVFPLQGLLYECNKMSADYLFQQDKHYDVGYDTGDKVIQCGRHNDIFKFWLMWRAKVKTYYYKEA